MRNRIKIVMIIFLITVIVFSMSACNTKENEDEFEDEIIDKNDDEIKVKNDDGQLHSTITKRYETVPVIFKNTSQSVRSTTVQGLLYSCYDKNYYYYVFILGHINFVPITYRDAVFYNGKTPITISYTKTNAIESSITRAVTIAIENSVSKTYNEIYDVTGEFEVKILNIGPKFIAKNSYEYGWVDTETRSISDTIETTKRKIDEDSDGISVTIRDHNEEPGKYRQQFKVYPVSRSEYMKTMSCRQFS